MELKFYVLNYNINKKEVENFNIFSNSYVNNRTIQEVKKYLRGPANYKYKIFGFGSESEKVYTGFEGFCRQLDSIIRCEEWGRCEYEIGVADAFESDISKLKKWDCYKQARPNIEIIAREVIYQAKQELNQKRKKK